MILRNLSEPEVGKVLFDHFRAAINALTIQDSGSRASKTTSGCATRGRSAPSRAVSCRRRDPCSTRSWASPMRTASSWRSPPSSKTRPTCRRSPRTNGGRLQARLRKADGDLSNYTPDFIVRTTDGTVWIVETKGREELDVPQKMARLRQWCADATEASEGDGGTRYGFVYVDQESFEQAQADVVRRAGERFREYQEG